MLARARPLLDRRLRRARSRPVGRARRRARPRSPATSSAAGSTSGSSPAPRPRRVTLRTETHPLERRERGARPAARGRDHRARRARAVSSPSGLAQGEVLWTPPADVARAVGARAATSRGSGASAGLDFAGLRRALALVGHRPRGLLGLVLGLLRDPGARAVRARARLARDARRGVVPRRAAELRRAHARPRRGHGRRRRRSPTRRRATRSSSPSATSASRSHGRAPACSGSASGPATASSRTCPNIPETLVAFLATASLGAIWATCPPEFGVRSVVHRLGQLEPTVLLAVAGYGWGDKLVDRREQVAAIREQLPTLRTVVHVPYAAGGRRAAGRRLVGRAARGGRRRSSSSRSRSRTRSTCCSRRGRPACRRRSCTATAASWSST